MNINTERELAKYIDAVLENEAWAESGTEAAKQIVHEFGWRPPARVLEGDWQDVEAALDALPMGAQIRWTTGEPIHVALGINRGAYWNVTTHGGPLSSYNIARDETPVEVIA